MEEIPFVTVRLVTDNIKRFPSRKIRNSEDAFNIVKDIIGDADRETLLVLLIDTQERVIAIHTAGVGSIDSQPVNPREIFKAAILANAHHVLLAHNHPSGSAKPSGKDITVTRDLIVAGQLMGIPILDHIIVGGETYTSLRNSGFLN